ncbi:hypothetical protein BC834DRAFT_601985 [Gloeopeniophorella convolvens]|nr:hypothetical protein BC834DRAFT_601985 [Gloeopeniophorella convolvens]
MVSVVHICRLNGALLTDAVPVLSTPAAFRRLRSLFPFPFFFFFVSVCSARRAAGCVLAVSSMTSYNITIEDSSPLITYNDISKWDDSASISDFLFASGPALGFGSVHQTNASTGIDIPFNGSAIYVYGSTSSSGGPFSASITPDISSNQIETTNYSSSSILPHFQQLLFNRTNLDPSKQHHLTLQNLGKGDFSLDYVVVENALPGPVNNATIDDGDGAFVYSGKWSQDIFEGSKNKFIGLLYDGIVTSHLTEDPNASATLTFQGSGVEVHGEYACGSYQAQLDNGSVQMLQNGRNASARPVPRSRPRELLYAASGLPEANHTLVLKYLGGACSSGFNIDYAIVSSSNSSGTHTRRRAFHPVFIPHSSSSGDGSPVSTGVIVAIVLGIIVLIAILCFILFRRHRLRKAKRASDAEAGRRASHEWDSRLDAITPIEDSRVALRQEGPVYSTSASQSSTPAPPYMEEVGPIPVSTPVVPLRFEPRKGGDVRAPAPVLYPPPLDVSHQKNLRLDLSEAAMSSQPAVPKRRSALPNPWDVGGQPPPSAKFDQTMFKPPPVALTLPSRPAPTHGAASLHWHGPVEPQVLAGSGVKSPHWQTAEVVVPSSLAERPGEPYGASAI